MGTRAVGRFCGQRGAITRAGDCHADLTIEPERCAVEDARGTSVGGDAGTLGAGGTGLGSVGLRRISLGRISLGRFRLRFPSLCLFRLRRILLRARRLGRPARLQRAVLRIKRDAQVLREGLGRGRRRGDIECAGGEDRRVRGKQHGDARHEHRLVLRLGVERIARRDDEIRHLARVERAGAGVDAEHARRSRGERGERLVLRQTVRDRIGQPLAERAAVLHAVGRQGDVHARRDEPLGVGGRVAPGQEIAERYGVGRRRRHEVRRLREVDRQDERRLGAGEERGQLGLRAELVAAAKDRHRGRGHDVVHQPEETRRVELIGRVEQHAVRAARAGQEGVERVHVVQRHRCARARRRLVAPVGVEQRLSHQGVGTHEARRVAAHALAARLRGHGGRARDRRRRRSLLLLEERCEVDAARAHHLRDAAVEREAERALGRLGEDAQVGRAAQDARARKHARNGEALLSQRFERGVGNGEFGGAHLGRHVLVPVRARRRRCSGGECGAVDRKRGLDECGEDGLARKVMRAIASGHGHVRSDRLDDAVADEDRCLGERGSGRDDHRGADERVPRRIARSHAVDRSHLGEGCVRDSEGGEHRGAGKRHGRGSYGKVRRSIAARTLSGSRGHQ